MKLQTAVSALSLGLMFAACHEPPMKCANIIDRERRQRPLAAERRVAVGRIAV